MSGGHFNYDQYRILQMSEDIDTLVRNNNKPDEDGYVHSFSPEVLVKFQEAVATLKEAHAMVQRVDWLVSGDDGEDSFLERWKEEVVPLQLKKKMFKKPVKKKFEV